MIGLHSARIRGRHWGMRWGAIISGLPLALAIHSVAAQPLHAAFHFYRIQEIFSTADGSTQFIELFSGPAGQNFLANHSLKATSDGTTRTFNILSNLTNGAANTTALFATANFQDLPGGVTPDYVIPSNFFNPSAASISIDFSSGVDVITFAGDALPKDGFRSLVDTIVTPTGGVNLTTADNSPRNSQGQNGMVDWRAPTTTGDFDADGDVDGNDFDAWEGGFGAVGGATRAQGDANSDGDVDGDDFLVWEREFRGPSITDATAVPEPSVLWAWASALVMAAWRRERADRRRDWERAR